MRKQIRIHCYANQKFKIWIDLRYTKPEQEKVKLRKAPKSFTCHNSKCGKEIPKNKRYIETEDSERFCCDECFKEHRETKAILCEAEKQVARANVEYGYIDKEAITFVNFNGFSYRV